MSFEEIKEEYDQKYQEELYKTGVFFAFNDAQFEEYKTHKDAKKSEYNIVGPAMFIHDSNFSKFKEFVNVTAQELKADFISKINIEDMIDYELKNHECFYTGEYDEIVSIIKGYYTDMSETEIFDKIEERYSDHFNELNEENSDIEM